MFAVYGILGVRRNAAQSLRDERLNNRSARLATSRLAANLLADHSEGRAPATAGLLAGRRGPGLRAIIIPPLVGATALGAG